MNYAPVALFVYDRPDHTRRTIEALAKNDLASETDLIIFSDASKTESKSAAVADVRAYIQLINGFKSVTIFEQDRNLGLAQSIIQGVTKVVNQYGKIIVLEDDLVTSPFFLEFMNDGLDFYKENTGVASIHAYVYPIEGLPETFFMRGADCWGWATWNDRWSSFETNGQILLDRLISKKLTRHFDLNGAYPFTQMLRDQISGKNNSWAIRWHALAFLENKFTLYPAKTLVLNIGNDSSGTHSANTDVYTSDFAVTRIDISTIPIEENVLAFKAFENYFKKQRGGLVRSLCRFVSRKLCGVFRWG